MMTACPTRSGEARPGRSRALATLILMLVSALGAGCEPPDTSPEPDTLTLMGTRNHLWITPLAVNTEEQRLVFLPLFHFGHPGTGGVNGVDPGLEGRLVKSWERTPDNRTWTYHLRTDVRWHDGVPVTARDIEFSMALWEHPAVLRAIPGDRTFTLLDDSTFSITYHRPTTGADVYQTFLPRHLLADLDPEAIEEWEFWDHPVGNGPYRYVRHVPGEFVELEANPDYYLGKPRIERLILRLGGGDPVVELKAGHVDIVDLTASPAVAADLDREARFRAVYDIGGRAQSILWNQHNPLFADVRVREALSTGLDRRELARAGFIPDDVRVTDLPLRNNQLIAGDYPDFLPYDPDRARELLAEAGWTDTDGDGWLDRDGVPFHFELLPWRAGDIWVLVQAQYRRLGIRMDIASIATEAFPNRFQEGDWDAAYYQPFAPPLSLLFDPNRAPPDFGYENAEIDEMLRVLGTSYTVDRDSVNRRFWEILRRDFPFTGLVSLVYVRVVHSRLRSRDNRFGTSHVDEMWIEEDWRDAHSQVGSRGGQQ
jgi:peptide/nickel transport system substrate-binding protein